MTFETSWLLCVRPRNNRRRTGRDFRTFNVVSGKPNLASTYAPRTINHNISVISAFYEYHRRALTGPLRNPVPERVVNGSRFGAHHNPEDEYAHGRRADYRQKVPVQAARSIPDVAFENLFSALGSDRDRALVAFYVSSAARPSELVGLTNGMVDVGNQCISVVRKGSGSIQRVPASAEAFLWFRLYQQSLPAELTGAGLSAWWTLRRPYRPMNYEAARAVIRRVNVVLGSNWTLHDFRHTAAMRMAQDPRVSITDIQAVLGHVHLSTTEAYLKPRDSEVIGRVNNISRPGLSKPALQPRNRLARLAIPQKTLRTSSAVQHGRREGLPADRRPRTATRARSARAAAQHTAPVFDVARRPGERRGDAERSQFEIGCRSGDDPRRSGGVRGCHLAGAMGSLRMPGGRHRVVRPARQSVGCIADEEGCG